MSHLWCFKAFMSSRTQRCYISCDLCDDVCQCVWVVVLQCVCTQTNLFKCICLTHSHCFLLLLYRHRKEELSQWGIKEAIQDLEIELNKSIIILVHRTCAFSYFLKSYDICMSQNYSLNVLKYILFDCIALHSAELHCFALLCIELHCFALNCIALICIELNGIALNSTELHCVALD